MSGSNSVAVESHSFFTVNDLPPEQRFEPRRDSIDCIFTVDATREVRQENFEASVEAWLMGSVMLARTRSKAQT